MSLTASAFLAVGLEHYLESIDYGQGKRSIGVVIDGAGLVFVRISQAKGEYEGTIVNPPFVVLLRHCHQRRGWAVWAAWARFVLVTSLLLCFRFSTLLARHYRRAPSE